VRVRVLFFGVLKDIAGRAEDTLEVPPGGRLQTVFDHYAGLFPRLREMAASILLARNQRFAALAAALEDGDEVAFLPPVSGGSDRYIQAAEDPDGHFFALAREPVDAAELRARLARPEDGGVVVFEGVARSHTAGRRTLYLEYDAYEPMALGGLAELGRGLARSHGLGRIGIVHRLGRVEVGQTIVAIVATAPHRQPAFEAAREAIDRLKRSVPIWKKEHFEDGEVWVTGQWDASVEQP